MDALNTRQYISATIYPANFLTGAKHSAISTNHLADNDENKHNYTVSQKNDPTLKRIPRNCKDRF